MEKSWLDFSATIMRMLHLRYHETWLFLGFQQARFDYRYLWVNYPLVIYCVAIENDH